MIRSRTSALEAMTAIGSKTTGTAILVRPIVWSWRVSSDARDAVGLDVLDHLEERSSSRMSRLRISA